MRALMVRFLDWLQWELLGVSDVFQDQAFQRGRRWCYPISRRIDLCSLAVLRLKNRIGNP